MRAVLWSGIARQEISARLQGIPGLDLVHAGNFDQFLALLADAEVLVVPTHVYDLRFAQALRDRAPRLRLIQLLSAGYEGPLIHGIPPGVVVASAGESWSPQVAEHAMALLLALVKRLPQIVENHGRRGWDRSFAAGMGALYGQTLAIVGFGSIGREVAQRARAFGMRTIGISRRAIPHALADEVHPVSALHQVLARSDAIVLAVPFSSESERMIGEAELAACRRRAVLVNIARGALIDPVALAAALRNGTLAGAALDVTEPEPLPPDDPLWASPNLIISPHVAGACGPSGRERLAKFVGENLRRFVAGEDLSYVIPL